ncbi:M61 family metallopeptidase [Pontimicrobium aquaticum]|uniref:Peptidase M61 n=1 Tax=Pontimicrobium aquaticum TaxID=2565367 RepID=A0A4U0EYS2_9FLAO|nr:peptidase M61 [Pontimicrobium aquaticum]TJY37058.1 peptidase M61 [Pontimicrobium aquaticum]
MNKSLLKKLFLLTVIVSFVSCKSSKNLNNNLASSIPISCEINVARMTDDKVPVIINPGKFTQDKVVYRIPRAIPGSYEIKDFGTYIENFKALDYNGNELSFTKIDPSSWEIESASNLDKIVYEVNDTFDDVDETGEPKIFPPGGTNIEPNNYVLNLHGFIGYFDSLKNNQYDLAVSAPTSFVRSSALESRGEKVNADGNSKTSYYHATRYFDITDNPMMYGDLDVEEFMVGDIKIVLSLFSPNKKHHASEIKETIYKMMEAQKAYLGNLNSTTRYDIFLYLIDKPIRVTGALEHHTSTVVVTQENRSKKDLADFLTDVVSHEFFHIVTPLSVHSEDVHYFDYNKPTFSKHLWMYEGLTEYFANHFQVKEGLISNEELYDRINSVIKSSRGYYDDTMSFTKMSENVIDEPYARNYGNVYQKGALIGMCLDILIREGSNGNRSVLSLMKELSIKYGKNKPFDDDKIIDEIVTMTYPSVGTFFNNHVIGTTPINYNQILQKVGLNIVKEKIPGNYILTRGGQGPPMVSLDQDNKVIRFNEWVKRNAFWTAQGALPNDIFREINGQEITLGNAEKIFVEQVSKWQPGTKIEVKLERDGKEIIIDATTTPVFDEEDVIRPVDNPTDKQVKIRNAWLKG